MLQFKQETFHSRIVLPSGETTERPIEIRTNPITGRTCKITYSRGQEREPDTGSLPEGFFEIWGILPGITSLHQTTEYHWEAFAQGVLNSQRYYRGMGHNGYNLGLLLFEGGSDDIELRVILTVRSNYAPWVRSDFTGFEVMLGDMATFSAPESTAQYARNYW